MAVPIGPAGILCIRKTLAEGRTRGLVVGLGAATADLLNGCVAAFGLTFISDMIASQQFWLRLTGGTLLLFLGIRLMRARHTDTASPADSKGLLGSYLSTLALGLTNPVTIFAFIAVFATLGLGDGLTLVSASILVLGVFTGTCLWFLILGYVATFFRSKLNSGGLRKVNWIAGGLILVSAAAAFVSVI